MNDQPTRPFFPTHGKELACGGLLLVSGVLLVNSVLTGGFSLGFALGAGGCILFSSLYLLLSSRKPTFYSTALLLSGLGIAAGFARSDDGFVKFVMVCFLSCAVNLGLCLTAGQNLRSPGRAACLADWLRTVFILGIGDLDPAWEGLRLCLRNSGPTGRKSGAVAMGCLIALPVLAILIPLLMRADRAFQAVLELLPRLDLAQIFASLLFGGMLGIWMFVRSTALVHHPGQASQPRPTRPGANVLTVNTVLSAVGFVYLVYLISQFAYFTGGFAGLLPQGYTMAEYARRGFFEMALLCGLNLTVICLCAASLRREPVPASTRGLCLFLSVVTVFLVAAASGKMFLYIGSYGLTRLRLLTQVIMLWLGLTTVLVAAHLFFPRFGYMKGTVLCAMVIGLWVFWMDVDTAVARYNVDAYLSGQMEQVDVEYLTTLNQGAVPYLEQLALQAPEESVQSKAEKELIRRAGQLPASQDFRGWNAVAARARKILLPYQDQAERDRSDFVSENDSVFWEGREYIPYRRVSKYHCGEYLGALEGEAGTEFFTLEGFPRQDWIIALFPSGSAVLLREAYVDYIPNGLEPDDLWTETEGDES